MGGTNRGRLGHPDRGWNAPQVQLQENGHVRGRLDGILDFSFHRHLRMEVCVVAVAGIDRTFGYDNIPPGRRDAWHGARMAGRVGPSRTVRWSYNT